MEADMSWNTWKKALGTAVKTADLVGMSDETVDKFAYRIGDFLANNLDPANREQRLLKELWEVGEEGEKKALAKMITKLVDNT
ncbi:MAG: hypothetical protein A4E52_00575 [Pelotomaculum sp. PtaB.Bin013]|uniref:DUF3243 domain-containing protein n=1 Tax=Pelotomaculum isophthalicicum JI TaxID=947010 RepID=A0A9X4JWK8_9FIRM|nr:DUF3243 domain-containing protein [Pelotomaculum isophthalicicum]MDF9409567.1 DUF3243 domain-containing protein [Pelotomaculum isophthalicicum JI]OPX91214.1 MAG: hypothetical protein A4E52_00575 [Pelotomaculum sp. PtaB.Bin013]